MNTDIILYKKITDSEIDSPTWVYTEQFLSANTILKRNGEYVIDRYYLNNDKTIDFYYNWTFAKWHNVV
jgi:hypothetical protein